MDTTKVITNCTAYLLHKKDLASGNVSGDADSEFGGDYSLAGMAQVIVGGVSFLIILPFVLFTFKKLPIGCTAACLLGALCMVVGGVIDQNQVYTVIGKKDHLQTIFLLWGMMTISLFFERERLLDRVLAVTLKSSLPFSQYILVIGVITFVVSALFTNDACCVIMTPILLKHWLLQNRKIVELETILLTIATSSNLGSVTTIFGNPQMALIAARTDSDIYELSRLNLLRCIIYLGPPALIVFGINLGFLILNFKLTKKVSNSKDTGNGESVGEKKVGKIRRHQIPISSCLGLYRVSSQDLNQSGSQTKTEINCVDTYETPVNGGAYVVNDNLLVDLEHVGEELKPSNSKIFKGLLIAIILLVVVLFFASSPAYKFDIGLVPVGGAILLLIADAVINKNNAVRTLHHLDWSILMMFFGIFVWLDGLNSTKLPRWLWSQLTLVNKDFSDFGSLCALFLFVTIGSNIFSNVPLTLIVLDQVPPCENHFPLMLYLGWVSTIAGNLTLFGSVANLIVAQKAEETLSYRFTFWKHLRFGFITTLILNFSGIVLIFGSLLIY